MNSLRSISDLLRLDRQPIAVGAVCLALTQSFLQHGRLLVALRFIRCSAASYLLLGKSGHGVAR
jgi:hypothetical protein